MNKEFLVYPSLPTSFGTQEKVPLIGTDLWLSVLSEYLIIVPGVLDMNRFQNALSKALGQFPDFAGRVKHDAGLWWIELNNSGVPLHVCEQSTIPLPTDDYVVVEDLACFDKFVSTINLDACNKDTPLVTIKVTINEPLKHTVLGYSANHIVADGYRGYQFLYTLSQLYQDEPVPEVSRTLPTSHIPEVLVSEPDVLRAGPSFYTSQCTSTNQAFRSYMKDARETVQIRLRFPPNRLEALRALMRQQGADNPNPSSTHEMEDMEYEEISRQDTISAYVAHLLSTCCESNTPIEVVRSNFNFRANKFVPQHRVGTNSVVFIQTPTLGDERTPGKIARQIRNSITRAKSAGFCENDLAFARQMMDRTANEGKCFAVLSPPNCLTVNGLANVHWASIHFGYPGHARFHTKWLSSRYLRLFPSNPHLSYDASGKLLEVKDPRERWIDVQFGAPKGNLASLTAQIDADMASLDQSQTLASQNSSLGCKDV